MGTLILNMQAGPNAQAVLRHAQGKPRTALGDDWLGGARYATLAISNEEAAHTKKHTLKLTHGLELAKGV